MEGETLYWSTNSIAYIGFAVGVIGVGLSLIRMNSARREAREYLASVEDIDLSILNKEDLLSIQDKLERQAFIHDSFTLRPWRKMRGNKDKLVEKITEELENARRIGNYWMI